MERIVVGLAGEAELFQVVLTTGSVSGFTNLLHCREQKRNQNPDYGDNHQQLDQRKSMPMACARVHSEIVVRNTPRLQEKFRKIPSQFFFLKDRLETARRQRGFCY